MNFYHLYLFLVVCFGPWVNAKVHFQLTETSAETESRRRSSEIGLPIIKSLAQAASHTKAWVQWLRKQLKALRKWCNSHPPEVKLGDAKERKFPKEFRSSPKTNVDYVSQRRDLKIEKPPGKIFSFLKTFLFWIFDKFFFYRDALFRHDLIVCTWDYSVKKFWLWIDAAPDSRFRM